MVENLTELLWLNRRMPVITQPDHLDGRTFTPVAQASICKVEAQHGEENIEESREDLRWLAAAPDRGKRQNADQIINAALKALDLGCTFHFLTSGSSR